MELLIRNYDRNAPPDWQLGDIVAVKDDGHEWGRQEDPRTRTDDPVDLFILLRIPGKAMGINIKRNFEACWDEINSGERTLLARKLWRVSILTLPAGVQAQIAVNGIAIIGWGVLKSHLTYVVDGSTGDEKDPEDGDDNA